MVGALQPTTPLDTTVVLKPRDPAALEAYATAVSTPGSSLYHHYLSVSQFRQQFAPTDSQIAAVADSLRRHGLTPGTVTANGLAIPVRSNAGGLSRAFSISLRRLRLHTGRTAFAPDQAPQLDASVAGLVQSVLGLDNLVVPHPLAVPAARALPRAVPHVVTGGPQPCGAASGVGYTADQLASAYRFAGLYGAGDQGAGQGVAIVELEPNSPSDIGAYQACYGTSTPVTYTSVDGGVGSGVGSAEAALDIEDVIGLAPQAAIDVYQAPNSIFNLYDDYNAIISADAQKVISVSWGVCEAQEGPLAFAENALFQEAAVQGQSIFSATGDGGSDDCGTGSVSVDDPASQPFVTGVGGTSLGSLGPPPSESVWNDSYGAGGGGVSSLWTMPSYQSGAPSPLNVINPHSSGGPCDAPAGSFCREVPDVSADADPATPLAIFYNGGWIGIGGTSAATPLFAALVALINASSACGGIPVGFASPVLYGSAGHAYSTDFNDVTSGSNGLFPAGPGYDMASGLGSPQGAQLAANICAPQVAAGNPGTQTSTVGAGVSLPVGGSDSVGYPLTYGASGLPPGLSINSNTGVISGTPRTTGRYAVTVGATDSRNRSGSSAFTWIVVPAIANPGNRHARVGKAIKLQISANDNNSGPLSYGASGLPRGLSIKSTTGLITGRPSMAGGYSVVVTAKTGAVSASVPFRWTITGPNVPRASLTGIAKGRPKLAFTLNAGPGSPAVKKLKITLPSGLRFRGGSSLAKGTSVVGSGGKRIGGYTLSLSKGRLTITLPKGARTVRVTVAAPAIAVTSRLRGQVGQKKVHQLGVTLNPTDTNRFTATVFVFLNPSSSGSFAVSHAPRAALGALLSGLGALRL